MAERNRRSDPQVSHALIKAVGIYPIGALVRLESGRLDVVLEQHGRSSPTLRVKAFFSARSKMPIPQRVIDLSRVGQTDRTVGFEPTEAWNFRNLGEVRTGLSSNGESYPDVGTGKPQIPPAGEPGTTPAGHITRNVIRRSAATDTYSRLL